MPPVVEHCQNVVVPIALTFTNILLPVTYTSIVHYRMLNFKSIQHQIFLIESINFQPEEAFSLYCLGYRPRACGTPF